MIWLALGLLLAGAELDEHTGSHWWSLLSLSGLLPCYVDFRRSERMRKLTQRGNKLKHTLDSWVEYKILGVTHQGQIIDYLIDDDDEEYLVRHKDDELKWVAGVALTPIEAPNDAAVGDPPAAEFLAEG